MSRVHHCRRLALVWPLRQAKVKGLRWGGNWTSWFQAARNYNGRNSCWQSEGTPKWLNHQWYFSIVASAQALGLRAHNQFNRAWERCRWPSPVQHRQSRTQETHALLRIVYASWSSKHPPRNPWQHPSASQKESNFDWSKQHSGYASLSPVEQV